MPAPLATLEAIQKKVRRLTRTPTLAQMEDVELNEYINTFILYDLPEHLRLFNLKRTFTFFSNPYQDVYETSSVITNPMYDFQNQYISIHAPIYIGGYQTYFSQSREQFFGLYPQTNFVSTIGVVGNNVKMDYTGNVNINFTGVPGANVKYALIQNNVLFSSVDINNAGLAMIDVPVINNVTGNPTSVGNLYPAGQTPATPPIVIDPDNFINYVTGAFKVTFSTPPKAGATINSQTIPYVAARPQGLLYFDNKFTLRPLPDQPYRIDMEVFVRPTYLIATDSIPELAEWWQYIAYGAAKKIFEDRMDMDSVQAILPEFKQQEMMVQRRTIVQLGNQRTATIYTEQTGPLSVGWGWNSGTNL